MVRTKSLSLLEREVTDKQGRRGGLSEPVVWNWSVYINTNAIYLNLWQKDK